MQNQVLKYKMHIKPQDIVKHELIGLDIEIVQSKNPSLIGIKGKIIDETKNTLLIETKNKNKRILKRQATFNIRLKDYIVQVEGKLLLGQPEDRIKK